MKSKSLIASIGISLLPLFLIVLNIVDISDVLLNKSRYPFGSEFFSPMSIYKSKEIYVTYNIVFTLMLIVLVIMAFKRNWKYFWIVLVIDVLMFFYPMITNT